MTSKIINAALLGNGRIGKMHAELIATLSQINIVAIADKQDADYEKKLKYIFEDKKIPAIVIAASSTAHVSLIERGIACNKAIFCEKPISFSAVQLKKLKKKITDNKTKLQVGLNRRFDPDFNILRSEIQCGAIGNVHCYKITNRDPKMPDMTFSEQSGGMFYDFSTHDFDMIAYLSGKKIKRVYATGGNIIDANQSMIDTALISMLLEDDSHAVIDTSRETGFGYDQRIEVFGEKGMLCVNNFNQTAVTELSRSACEIEAPYWSFKERYQEAYRKQFLVFSDYIHSEDITSPVDISAMGAAVACADAAEQSVKLKKPIEVCYHDC